MFTFRSANSPRFVRNVRGASAETTRTIRQWYFTLCPMWAQPISSAAWSNKCYSTCGWWKSANQSPNLNPNWVKRIKREASAIDPRSIRRPILTIIRLETWFWRSGNVSWTCSERKCMQICVLHNKIHDFSIAFYRGWSSAIKRDEKRSYAPNVKGV